MTIDPSDVINRNIKLHDSIVRKIINAIDTCTDNFYPYKLGKIKTMSMCKVIYGFYVMEGDMLPLRGLEGLTIRLDEVDGWWLLSTYEIGVLPVKLFNTIGNGIHLEDLMVTICNDNLYAGKDIIEPILTGFLDMNKDVYVGPHNLSKDNYVLKFGKVGVSINGKDYLYDREECSAFNGIIYQTKG